MTAASNDAATSARQVQDLVRKLEQVHAEAKSATDLFTSRALQLRARIRDMCFKIRLSDFGEDGRKAEDTIWRRVFHSVMQKFKRFPEAPTARATSLMECHFLSAVGFYCNLIHMFAEMGLDVSIIMNTCNDPRCSMEDNDVKTALSQAVHRCLTYMGDSYRYLDELATASAKSNATYWYNKAIIWEPANGMPFNQLATLMLQHDSNSYGLDAVYYYLRCMSSENAFEGAEVNLKRIISSRLKEGIRNNPTHDAVRIVRACIESFRHISCQILFSSSETSEALISSIDNFILSLNQAAKLPSTIAVPSKPACLDDAVWFKIGLIIMMEKLRVNRGDKRQAVLYLLRHFFVSLITTLTSRITYFCVHKGDPPDKASPPASCSDSSESDNRKSRENTPESSPFRQAVRSRRRKRGHRREDNQDSDLSELEETALRAIDALDISTDYSGDDFSDAASSQSSQEEQGSQSFCLKTTQVVGLDCEKLDERNDSEPVGSSLQQLYQHSPIQTVKVFCDFFASNPQVLEACACDRSQMQSLADLVNLCVRIESEVTADPSWTFKLMKRPLDPEWQQRIPLPCDWTLLRFPLLSAVHKDLLFSASSRRLQKAESSFLCLQRIISFGVTASRITQVIDYDADHYLFTLPPPGKSSVLRPATSKLVTAQKGSAK